MGPPQQFSRESSSSAHMVETASPPCGCVVLGSVSQQGTHRCSAAVSRVVAQHFLCPLCQRRRSCFSREDSVGCRPQQDRGKPIGWQECREKYIHVTRSFSQNKYLLIFLKAYHFMDVLRNRFTLKHLKKKRSYRKPEQACFDSSLRE